MRCRTCVFLVAVIVLEPDGRVVLSVVVGGEVSVCRLPASMHCVFSLCFVLRMSLVESFPEDSMLSSGQISYSLSA